MKNLIVGALVLLVGFACQTDEGLSSLSQSYSTLADTWIKVERGYSPGSGYIIDPVPAEPAQLITFLPDRKLHSNISHLSDVEYYLLTEDSSSGDHVLSLYHLDPVENPGQSPASSYTLVFEDGIMKLYYRWCIEGCHMGFKPYKQRTDE